MRRVDPADKWTLTRHQAISLSPSVQFGKRKLLRIRYEATSNKAPRLLVADWSSSEASVSRFDQTGTLLCCRAGSRGQ
jgi:hypothetical protein